MVGPLLQSEVPNIVTDDLTIDLAAKRIRTATGDVHVTSTEWRLIEVLVRNAGKVATLKRPTSRSLGSE